MESAISRILAGVAIPATHTGRILRVDRTSCARYITSFGDESFLEAFADQMDIHWKREHFKMQPDGVATNDGYFVVEFKGRHCTLCFQAFIELTGAYVVEYTCIKSDDVCVCICV